MKLERKEAKDVVALDDGLLCAQASTNMEITLIITVICIHCSNASLFRCETSLQVGVSVLHCVLCVSFVK